MGKALSVAALCTSWALSLWAVYSIGFDADMAIMWIAIICISEASKFVANSVFWRPGFWRKIPCLGWYAAGVAVSVYMIHSYVESRMRADTAGETKQIQLADTAKAAEASRVASIRAELKAAEDELEAARTAIYPEVGTIAAIKHTLAGRLSTSDRRTAEEELAKAEANGQWEGKIVRLEAKIRKIKAQERPGPSIERPASETVHAVRAVRYVRDDLSMMAYVLAGVLELAICGGMWADARLNAPPPPPPPVSIPTPPPSKSVTPTDREFEDFMLKLWKSRRGPDGWLEGTNREWSELAGVSSKGFVHAQLKRMAAESKIELRPTPRKTFLRFIQIAKLKAIT